jgi:hypothetical protein
MLHAILLLVVFWLHGQTTLPLRAVERYASDELEAVETVVWMKHESDFGRVRHGSYAPCDHGLMQLHNRPDLEGPEHDAESVRVWLAIKHANARLCGDDGLASLSSGRCDRGTRLAEARRQEAKALWILAAYAVGRP